MIIVRAVIYGEVDMNKISNDRKVICRIISEMLDNPDDCGIYPTTKCYDSLEQYINSVRYQSIGWMFEYACQLANEGRDIKKVGVSEIMAEAYNDLEMKRANDWPDD